MLQQSISTRDGEGHAPAATARRYAPPEIIHGGRADDRLCSSSQPRARQGSRIAEMRPSAAANKTWKFGFFG